MSRAQTGAGILAVGLVAVLDPAVSAWARGAGGFVASTLESSSLTLQAGGPDLSRSSGQSSGSSNKSSDDSSRESSGSSDSSSDDRPPRKPRKLTIPQQVRDEAVLWLAGSATAPPSALLRSTVQAFRQVLIDEGQRPPPAEVALSDRAVLTLLLQRAEGVLAAAEKPPTAPASSTVARSQQLVHAQAVSGTQAGGAQGRVQGRKQADQQGHAADKRHLDPRDVRR